MPTTPSTPRQVTDSDKRDILIPIVGDLAKLTFGAPGLFFDRQGFISGGGADSPFTNVVRDVTRLSCRVWARSDKSAHSVRQNRMRAELCGPYLDSLGENPDDPTVTVPFEGGQCNEAYVVTWASNNDDGTTSGASVLARGPIGGVRRTVVGNQFTNELFSNGLNAGVSSCGSISDSGPAWRALSGGMSVTPGGSISITNVSPCGADNCGNPPPVLQPPGAITGGTPPSPTINIDIPGVGPVDVTVTINPTGDTEICIPILGVCGDVEDTGYGSPSGGGGGDGGPSPGDVGSPGTGETAGVDDAEGEAPTGSVLTGLKLTLTTVPPFPKEFAPGVYRGACYIYMGTPAGLDQDYAGSMITSGQFVFAEKDNLTKWRVSANSGYVIDVIPYYREME